MITFLEGILITLFEAINMKMFFETFMGKSNCAKEWIRKTLVVFIVMGLLLVAFVNSDVVIVKPVIAIAIISIMMWLYYRENLIQIIILASIFDGFLYAADYLSILMVKYLFQDKFTEIWNNQTKSVFIALASKTLVFIIVVFVSKKWNKEDSFNLISDAEWVRFIYFPALTIVAITVLLAERNDMSDSLLIIGFGLVIMNLVVFYLIRDIVSRERRIQTLRLTDERTKNQLEFYENMKETYDKQKQNAHDFKNQIGCINELLLSNNIEEALEYTKKISNIWSIEGNYINTNHAITNAIINQKYVQAKEKNILLVITCNDLSNIQMDNVDIVTLLANLLDNAIEACEKEKNEKIIYLKFIDEPDNIIISVKNSIEKPIEVKNNIIKTTKKEKNEHGIGMTNIEMVIKKYNGESIIECKDGYFIYCAIIEKHKL